MRPSVTPSEGIVPKHQSINLLLDSIGSMFVTYPPCKTLGLYHIDDSFECVPSPLALLGRIRNNDGIRASEVIGALERYAPVVLSNWLRCAREIQDIIADAHWIDDIWQCPASTRIFIHLNNREMRTARSSWSTLYMSGETRAADAAAAARIGYGAHITRIAQMTCQPFRESREGESLPEELFEPMKSETGRHR